MIRKHGRQPAWSNILLQLHNLTNGSFMVEGAIRVLQAATLLEGDPDTRGSGERAIGLAEAASVRATARRVALQNMAVDWCEASRET